MQTRLIRNKSGSLFLLLANGKMLHVEKKRLSNYLFHHKKLLKSSRNTLSFEVAGKWDDGGYDEITEYPGETIAYTNNKGYLVIVEVTPFEESLTNKKGMEEDVMFLTVKEYAEKYGKSSEQVKVFCRHGRIDGAKKIGRDWMIPQNAPYPPDRRVKSGSNIKKEEEL